MHCNFRKHMQIEKAPANQEHIFINLTAGAANAHNTNKSVRLFFGCVANRKMCAANRKKNACKLKKELSQFYNTCAANAHNTTK